MKRPPNHDDRGYDSFEDEEVDKLFIASQMNKASQKMDIAKSSPLMGPPAKKPFPKPLQPTPGPRRQLQGFVQGHRRYPPVASPIPIQCEESVEDLRKKISELSKENSKHKGEIKFLEVKLSNMESEKRHLKLQWAAKESEKKNLQQEVERMRSQVIFQSEAMSINVMKHQDENINVLKKRPGSIKVKVPLMESKKQGMADGVFVHDDDPMDVDIPKPMFHGRFKVSTTSPITNQPRKVSSSIAVQTVTSRESASRHRKFKDVFSLLWQRKADFVKQDSSLEGCFPEFQSLMNLEEKHKTERMEKEVLDLPYYHGLLPREDMKTMLKKKGDFVLRMSEPHAAGPRAVVLSVLVDEEETKIKHFVVRKVMGKYSVGKFSFDTVADMVGYHLQKGECLTDKDEDTVLRNPVGRQSWELDHHDIETTGKLGEGAYGEVHLGSLSLRDGRKVPVAIKSAKLQTLTKDRIKEIMREARLMRSFDHPHVVKFYGVAAGTEPLMVVMELVHSGSLDSYLDSNPHLPPDRRMEMCTQAAWGVEYLHHVRRVIHRDLAARNCLYGDGKVKISDFGLAQEGTTYAMQPSQRVPIRWLAPETLGTAVYSRKTDVWAYGVLCWEVFSRQQPYPGKTVGEVSLQVQQGYRMAFPGNTPADMALFVVRRCWSERPEDRASMTEVVRELQLMTGLQKPGLQSITSDQHQDESLPLTSGAPVPSPQTSRRQEDQDSVTRSWTRPDESLLLPLPRPYRSVPSFEVSMTDLNPDFLKDRTPEPRRRGAERAIQRTIFNAVIAPVLAVFGALLSLSLNLILLFILVVAGFSGFTEVFSHVFDDEKHAMILGNWTTSLFLLLYCCYFPHYPSVSLGVFSGSLTALAGLTTLCVHPSRSWVGVGSGTAAVLAAVLYWLFLEEKQRTLATVLCRHYEQCSSLKAIDRKSK